MAQPTSMDRNIPEEQDYDQLAYYCRALSHPVRIEILRLLVQEGTCLAGHIAEHFEKAHSTVSEHLKVLKSAGLVSGTIDGPKRCYCANPVAIEEITRHFALLSHSLKIANNSQSAEGCTHGTI